MHYYITAMLAHFPWGINQLRQCLVATRLGHDRKQLRPTKYSFWRALNDPNPAKLKEPFKNRSGSILSNHTSLWSLEILNWVVAMLQWWIVTAPKKAALDVWMYWHVIFKYLYACLSNRLRPTSADLGVLYTTFYQPCNQLENPAACVTSMVRWVLESTKELQGKSQVLRMTTCFSIRLWRACVFVSARSIQRSAIISVMAFYMSNTPYLH